MTPFHAVENVIESGAVAGALHSAGAGHALACVRDERVGDVAGREALLDQELGPARKTKSSEVLRAGRQPAEGLALVALVDGAIVGSVRLWHVRAGDREALLLGPLAVDARFRSIGLGSALMRESIARAREAGHGAILLVGDASYYGRFGFSETVAMELDMPGPVDRERFLGLELEAGWLAGQTGTLLATGDFAGLDCCSVQEVFSEAA